MCRGQRSQRRRDLYRWQLLSPSPNTAAVLKSSSCVFCLIFVILPKKDYWFAAVVKNIVFLALRQRGEKCTQRNCMNLNVTFASANFDTLCTVNCSEVGQWRSFCCIDKTAQTPAQEYTAEPASAFLESWVKHPVLLGQCHKLCKLMLINSKIHARRNSFSFFQRAYPAFGASVGPFLTPCQPLSATKKVPLLHLTYHCWTKYREAGRICAEMQK